LFEEGKDRGERGGRIFLEGDVAEIGQGDEFRVWHVVNIVG